MPRIETAREKAVVWVRIGDAIDSETHLDAWISSRTELPDTFGKAIRACSL